MPLCLKVEVLYLCEKSPTMSEKRHEIFMRSVRLVELSDIDDAKVSYGIIKNVVLNFNLFIFFFFYFIHGSPESSDFSVGLLLTPHPGTMRLLEKKILK